MKGHHNDIQEDPRFRRYGPAAAQNISYMPTAALLQEMRLIPPVIP